MVMPNGEYKLWLVELDPVGSLFVSAASAGEAEQLALAQLPESERKQYSATKVEQTVVPPEPYIVWEDWG